MAACARAASGRRTPRESSSPSPRGRPVGSPAAAPPRPAPAGRRTSRRTSSRSCRTGRRDTAAPRRRRLRRRSTQPAARASSRACAIRLGAMSMPVTRAPARAAGMARLPVPHATSSTDSPGRSASRAMNSSAPGAKLRRDGEKVGRGPHRPGAGGERVFGPGADVARWCRDRRRRGCSRMTCQPPPSVGRARPRGAVTISLRRGSDSAYDWPSRLPARAYRFAEVEAESAEGLRSGGAASLAPGARGEPGRLLERPAERGLGVVPDLRADRGDLGAALGQEVGRDLHPPLGEVLHRRLADELGEPLGHVGAGRCRLLRQLGEGPGVSGPGMEQRQRPGRPLRREGRRASRSVPAAGPRGSAAAPR